MVVLKALSLILAGFLSFLAVSLVMREMELARVKATARPRQPQPVRRLRQDPRTGIYFPEA